MNFNFGEVLSRAWQIVWKHRVLWIFGILASCSRGGSGFNTGNSGSGSDSTFEGGTPNLPPEMLRFFDFLDEKWISLLTVTIAVICVIWIVAIFLGTIGRIGLIRGTWQAETDEGNLIFGQLFSESLPYFWRVFGSPMHRMSQSRTLSTPSRMAAAQSSALIAGSTKKSDDGSSTPASTTSNSMPAVRHN